MRTFGRSTITPVITSLLLSLLSHPFSVESAFFTGSVPTTAAAKHVDVAHHYMKGIKESMTTPLRLYVVDVQSVDEARNVFFLWFFGASGGAGIARSAFPRMLRNFQTVRQLANEQDEAPDSRRSDEIIPISFICGYPKPIYREDVTRIVKNPLSVEQIVSQYPIENNFLSKNGYLTYPAYQLAHPNANPFTLRVIFDSFNTNSDVCPPNQAQDILDQYQEDAMALSTNIVFAKLRGYLAIFTLLSLFALADYEAFVIYFREGNLSFCDVLSVALF
jgi:hypothetical protein